MEKTIVDTARAEHAGQYMFPAQLEQARALHREGRLDEAIFREVEEVAIRQVVEAQRQAGLTTLTDGELCRTSWDLDFLTGFDGVAKLVVNSGHIWQDVELGTIVPEIIGTIAYNAGHPYLRDLEFLTTLLQPGEKARITLPAPAHLYLWLITHYPNAKAAEDLACELAQAYSDTLRRMYEVGCRSVLMRDPSWGTFCDPDRLARLLQGGHNPMALMTAMRSINDAALQGLPADMERILFVKAECTATSRHASELYQEIVNEIFSHENVTAYMADYELVSKFIERAVMEFPHDKGLILGVVDACHPQLETSDVIHAKAERVLEHIQPAWLGLSPTDGFKVNHNVIDTSAFTEEDQWRKLQACSLK